MRGTLKIIKIKDISIFVHWSFLLLITWVFIANVVAGMQLAQVAWSVIFIIAVFACIILHELGHALAASQFGINAKNIYLLPIGGVASIEKLPGNPRQELIISAAGPLVNLLIALALTIVTPLVPATESLNSYPGAINSGNFFYSLYLVNLSLAVFNLIPAFPLDGGRILRALLGFKYNYVRATAIAAGIGKAIAWVFIVFGLVTLNFFLSLIGLFILFFAGTEEYYLRLKSLVNGIKLKEALMYDYNSLQADMTVNEAASILINNHNKYFIVMDRTTPVGTINRLQIVEAIAEMKYDCAVKKLMKEDLKFFDGDAEIEDILDQLATSDERIYPVMENGEFIGVVNFQHIIEYLLIHKAHTTEYNRVRSLVGLL